MKNYMKFIKIDLIICAVLAVILGVLMISQGSETEETFAPRTNDVCTNTERVFDYADKMTDEEEDQLRALIAEREPQIQADIILVTLDEPMSDEDVMVFSDDFQDEEAFGYNEPYGNCAMLVDNWDSSNTFMWFHTAGNVFDRYGNDDITALTDYVCETVNDDPYSAYVNYVNQVYGDMTGNYVEDTGAFFVLLILADIIIVAVFLFVNLFRAGRRKTTVATTYMKDHAYKEIEKSDVFLSKHTTSRKIETSSSSGGGGAHTSGGGHSYGGGGSHH